MLVAPLQLLGNMFKAAPGPNNKPSYFHTCVKENGVCWELSIGEHVPLQLQILKAVCNVMNVKEEYAPAWLIKGTFTNMMASALGGQLFDPKALQAFDDHSSSGLIQFACGTVLNLRTCQTSAGRAEMMITKNTGYTYPAIEIERCDFDGLVVLLNEAKTFQLFNPDARALPSGLVDRLNSFMQAPHFEIVNMLHNSFTTRRPNGEEYGGWMVLFFRLCVVAAALLGVAEHYCLDNGVDGENGKGFLWAICENVFGTYCATLSIGLLTHDPPEAGKVDRVFRFLLRFS